MTDRLVLIAEVLRTELGRHTRLGVTELESVDIEAIAAAIDAALAAGSLPGAPEEGLSPEELTSANSG